MSYSTRFLNILGWMLKFFRKVKADIHVKKEGMHYLGWLFIVRKSTRILVSLLLNFPVTAILCFFITSNIMQILWVIMCWLLSSIVNLDDCLRLYLLCLSYYLKCLTWCFACIFCRPTSGHLVKDIEEVEKAQSQSRWIEWACEYSCT